MVNLKWESPSRTPVTVACSVVGCTALNDDRFAVNLRFVRGQAERPCASA